MASIDNLVSIESYDINTDFVNINQLLTANNAVIENDLTTKNLNINEKLNGVDINKYVINDNDINTENRLIVYSNNNNNIKPSDITVIGSDLNTFGTLTSTNVQCNNNLQTANIRINGNSISNTFNSIVEISNITTSGLIFYNASGNEINAKRLNIDELDASGLLFDTASGHKININEVNTSGLLFYNSSGNNINISGNLNDIDIDNYVSSSGVQLLNKAVVFYSNNKIKESGITISGTDLNTTGTITTTNIQCNNNLQTGNININGNTISNTFNGIVEISNINTSGLKFYNASGNIINTNQVNTSGLLFYNSSGNIINVNQVNTSGLLFYNSSGNLINTNEVNTSGLLFFNASGNNINTNQMNTSGLLFFNASGNNINTNQVNTSGLKFYNASGNNINISGNLNDIDIDNYVSSSGVQLLNKAVVFYSNNKIKESGITISGTDLNTTGTITTTNVQCNNNLQIGNININGNKINNTFNSIVEISNINTSGLIFYNASGNNLNSKLNGLNYPTIDGTSGQVIGTDGAGNLGFITQAGGGGTGDVVGPSSSTDTAIPVFDGITGKLLKNTGVKIDAINTITGVNDIYTDDIHANDIHGNALFIGGITGLGAVNFELNSMIVGNKTITDIDNPTVGTAVANKQYVDGVVAPKISEVVQDGSPQLGGALDCNTYKIINLPNGTNATDAVNKGQLDAITADFSGTLVLNNLDVRGNVFNSSGNIVISDNIDLLGSPFSRIYNPSGTLLLNTEETSHVGIKNFILYDDINFNIYNIINNTIQLGDITYSPVDNKFFGVYYGSTTALYSDTLDGSGTITVPAYNYEGCEYGIKNDGIGYFCTVSAIHGIFEIKSDNSGSNLTNPANGPVSVCYNSSRKEFLVTLYVPPTGGELDCNYMTSSTGYTWSAQTPTLKNAFYSKYINDKYFIMSYRSSTAVDNFTYSTDGVSWTNINISGVSLSKAIAYGKNNTFQNGVYVVLSNGTNQVSYSTTLTSGTWSSTFLENELWEDILFFKGYFIAINMSGRVKYSYNLVNWFDVYYNANFEFKKIKFLNNNITILQEEAAGGINERFLTIKTNTDVFKNYNNKDLLIESDKDLNFSLKGNINLSHPSNITQINGTMQINAPLSRNSNIRMINRFGSFIKSGTAGLQYVGLGSKPEFITLQLLHPDNFGRSIRVNGAIWFDNSGSGAVVGIFSQGNDDGPSGSGFQSTTTSNEGTYCLYWHDSQNWLYRTKCYGINSSNQLVLDEEITTGLNYKVMMIEYL